VKKFNQARVNGGSNYDSLNLSNRERIGGARVTDGLMPSSQSLRRHLQDGGLLFMREVGLGKTSWIEEGPLRRRRLLKSASQRAE
jgi:hypothetical protein